MAYLLITLLAIAAGFAGADRQVLPTGDLPTSAERRYLLQQAEDGYTCWLLKTFSRAVCIEVFLQNVRRRLIFAPTDERLSVSVLADKLQASFALTSGCIFFRFLLPLVSTASQGLFSHLGLSHP